MKEYETSGTQATVLSALQHAIKEHGNDHGTLMQVIIDIILNNRMCKLFFSGLHEVFIDVHQQSSSFN